jgi:hypothetical protein
MSNISILMADYNDLCVEVMNDPKKRDAPLPSFFCAQTLCSKLVLHLESSPADLIMRAMSSWPTRGGMGTWREQLATDSAACVPFK